MAPELLGPTPGGPTPAAPESVDPFAPDLALQAPGPLWQFNRAGVLDAADIHVARTLGGLAGVEDPRALLAVALAVRAPRLGHIFVDLESIASTVAADAEEDAADQLDWPTPAAWIAAVAACGSLVAPASADAGRLPLRLDGSRLYLSRYWEEERELAAVLSALAGAPLRQVDLDWLTDALARLFPEPDDQLQRAAAASGVLRGLTVIAGGPGTGKTTTVARLVALLGESATARGEPAPLIGLCAPTGKAAARLTEAVQAEAMQLPIGEPTREAMQTTVASTIHRLLGWLPGGRFRHDATNRLPHDVVIVDETSMVPLSLMTRLLRAVRPDAQVILVGDPDQLTAIEAGAVLRDIVGPAEATPASAASPGATGFPRPSESPDALRGASAPTPARSFGDGVIVLRRGHRYGEAIGELADAIRRGDGDATVAAASQAAEIDWIAVTAGVPASAEQLAPLRAQAVAACGQAIVAARAGDGAAALAALGSFRLLCAHRRGPHGVSHWTAAIEQWLAEAIEGFDPSAPDYPGRPLLVTENDYELRLSNGDTGVIVEGLGATFERDGRLVAYAASRLGAVETLYAMTIHKAQGSQFDLAAVILPEPGSRILTRELLYTAITRARARLILVGGEDSLRAAVARPVTRATGLRDLLWGPPS